MNLNALASLQPVMAATSAVSSKSVVLARKALDQAQADGQAAVSLINAAGAVGPDGRGRRVNTVA